MNLGCASLFFAIVMTCRSLIIGGISGLLKKRTSLYPVTRSSFILGHSRSFAGFSDLVDYSSADKNLDSVQWGEFDILNSRYGVRRSFVDVKLLGTVSGPPNDTAVWLRGRVASVRSKGNACFITLRCDSLYTVQACFFNDKTNPTVSQQMLKFLANLKPETIIDVLAVTAAADVKSCTQNNVELHIRKALIVSKPSVVLPFLLEDAALSQEELDAAAGSDRPLSGVSQETRLNNRWLDLRVPTNHAIMRIRSAVNLLFRESLSNEDFIEINTPKLISGVSTVLL
jgi:hypothetical protein